MSEDKTTAVEEAVSETPAKETPQSSPNDELIAESKKYRKRAQEAEARLAKYEKAKSQAEEDRLKDSVSKLAIAHKSWKEKNLDLNKRHQVLDCSLPKELYRIT